MTNKEAAKLLKEIRLNLGRRNGKTLFFEALDLAIKGLEFIDENFPETFKDYLNGYEI